MNLSFTCCSVLFKFQIVIICFILQLITSRKLDKNLLPPKKVFGNQSEAFIKKRQNDLEAYLQTVLYFVADKPPSCLAAFLDFSYYVRLCIELTLNALL